MARDSFTEWSGHLPDVLVPGLATSALQQVDHVCRVAARVGQDPE